MRDSHSRTKPLLVQNSEADALDELHHISISVVMTSCSLPSLLWGRAGAAVLGSIEGYDGVTVLILLMINLIRGARLLYRPYSWSSTLCGTVLCVICEITVSPLITSCRTREGLVERVDSRIFLS